MFKNIIRNSPYIFLVLLCLFILGDLLIIRPLAPLSSAELSDIKDKMTLLDLKIVSIGSKEFMACGKGHSYKIPILVENKTGNKAYISYCSGSLFSPSQIKL